MVSFVSYRARTLESRFLTRLHIVFHQTSSECICSHGSVCLAHMHQAWWNQSASIQHSSKSVFTWLQFLSINSNSMLCTHTYLILLIALSPFAPSLHLHWVRQDKISSFPSSSSFLSSVTTSNSPTVLASYWISVSYWPCICSVASTNMSTCGSNICNKLQMKTWLIYISSFYMSVTFSTDYQTTLPLRLLQKLHYN